MNRIEYYDLITPREITKFPFSRENFTTMVKPDLGKGSFSWHNSGNGIATEMCQYTLKQDSVLTIPAGIPGAVLYFNFGNSIQCTYRDQNQYTIKSGSFHIGFTSENFFVEMNMRKNIGYHTLTIGIKEELFLHLVNHLDKTYLEKMQETKAKGYALLEGGEIDLKQRDILSFFTEEQIESDLLKTLSLESKAIGLLHYTMGKMAKRQQAVLDSSIDSTRIASLEKARQFILSEYEKPLSIREIAYKSAINECYLKKDFKAYYGMTIHEMLKKQRLEKAKELLQNYTSVNETAHKVGYRHAGHFSKLFFEHFGVTPHTYRKSFSTF